MSQILLPSQILLKDIHEIHRMNSSSKLKPSLFVEINTSCMQIDCDSASDILVALKKYDLVKIAWKSANKANPLVLACRLTHIEGSMVNARQLEVRRLGKVLYQSYNTIAISVTNLQIHRAMIRDISSHIVR